MNTIDLETTTRFRFAPGVRFTERPDGGAAIDNGEGDVLPIDAVAVPIMRAFAEPTAICQFSSDEATLDGLREIVGELERRLVLVRHGCDPEHEMRLVWNHLAGVTVEKTLYYIDNESGSIEEFERSGREAVEAIARLTPIGPVTRAVTIGCGMGRIERFLAPRIAHVDAFDVSDRMIERAGEYLQGVRGVELHRTDGTLRPVDDGVADVVLTFLVLQHVTREAAFRYFAEAARVLRRGGVFLFQLHCHDDMQAARRTDETISLVDRYYGKGKTVFLESEVRARLCRLGFDVELVRDGDAEGIERRLTGTPGSWRSVIIKARRVA